jgi:hypothetical protein
MEKVRHYFFEQNMMSMFVGHYWDRHKLSHFILIQDFECSSAQAADQAWALMHFHESLMRQLRAG